MFESDDFDQILSQFDFPEVAKAGPQETVIPYSQTESQDFIDCTKESTTIAEILKRNNIESTVLKDALNHEGLAAIKDVPDNKESTVLKHAGPNFNNGQDYYKQFSEQKQITAPVDHFISPKHLKRKIISSHFDQQSKRKFPGPAGLLTGALEGATDESIAKIEFSSQDMDFTDNNLCKDLFESPLWKRLLNETEHWNVNNVDSIRTIKQQALAGNLRRRKAQTVTAFVEAIDRSGIDLLISLRDETGSIKCTLHRDAWSKFSRYIVSDHCALVIQRPTVLTTGGTFKKHYLNITLSNILAIYSSAVLKEDKEIPDSYRIVYEEDFTVIKAENCSDNNETLLTSRNTENIFDDLENFFSDELF